MTKVLYLSYDGMTDPLGQSQVIPYLAGLTKEGYEIHLVSFEKKNCGSPDFLFVSELLKSAVINWHPLSYTKKPPVLSTIKDIVLLRKLSNKLQKEHKFSIVHCRSYITALVGMYLKKKYGLRFIFDMRGFWADERIDGKIWNIRNPIFNLIYHYFKRKEQEFLKNADYTITLTHKAKNIICSWPDSPKYAPVEVIPCCVDTELFDYSNIKNDEIPFKKSPDEFVICYLGAIGTWYMLDEMMQFFAKLLKIKPNSRFLFVTQEQPLSIITVSRKYGIDSERISIFKATRREVPSYLTQADAAIFFILPTFSKQASSPTKQGELMAMGLPIICNAGVGDTDYVIEKYQCGLLIHDLAGFDAWQEIDNLKNIPKENIRRGALEFYGLKTGIQRYKSVYRQVLGEVIET